MEGIFRCLAVLSKVWWLEENWLAPRSGQLRQRSEPASAPAEADRALTATERHQRTLPRDGAMLPQRILYERHERAEETRTPTFIDPWPRQKACGLQY